MSFALMLLGVIPGFFFLLIAAVGALRLPDFYTRSHAIGVTDTLGSLLILGGLVLYYGVSFVSAKLLFVALFLFTVNPAATYVLMRAAVRCGLPLRPLNGNAGTAQETVTQKHD